MALNSNSIPYSWGGTTVTLNYERDKLLTTFAKATLTDRYIWPGEDFQKMFARVAIANSNDEAHAQRCYDYISKLWFMPATPVLSNSGHDKALPISCFLNNIGDNLEDIFDTLNENNWLAARGGGIGTNWDDVREMDAPVGTKGKTSGIIPFIHMQDAATLGVSQGGLRRGSAAAYLNIDHPEVLSFIDMRRPKGDPNRQNLNIHHGVNITNAFMEAVRNKQVWQLKSRLTGETVKEVDAQELFQKLVITRVETGEPYLWFVDNANDQRPDVYKKNELYNSQSNLCSEITLTTQIDYNNKRRTAVCCLSSTNLEYFLEWENDPLFIQDIMFFLDNVMTSFINKTEGLRGFDRARYAAMMERSIGLGVMGFHSFLQSKRIPLEGVMAKVWNKRMFSHLKMKGDAANLFIALERGACPDAVRAGIMKRFSHIFAVAPTASISIIAGESSPGIEPYNANCYTQKTLSGKHFVKNKWLNALLRSKFVELHDDVVFDAEYDAREKAWVDKQWARIIETNGVKGSVQHLEYLDDHDKDVFKTAFEMDQNWLVELAADRQPFICQGQSLNLFLPATVDKKLLVKLHYKAWKLGLKGLYYLRSRSVAQAANTAGELPVVTETKVHIVEDYVDDSNDECLACQ
jgi:ribonucleoside-diphosphate reductase alpha chain